MKALLPLLCSPALPVLPQQLGSHRADYDAYGILEPWAEFAK